MKIGYVRVSKQAQHEALQIDALKEASCDKWFVDKITGSNAERKGLDEALTYLRSGDTLVMRKLDRISERYSSNEQERARVTAPGSFSLL